MGLSEVSKVSFKELLRDKQITQREYNFFEPLESEAGDTLIIIMDNTTGLLVSTPIIKKDLAILTQKENFKTLMKRMTEKLDKEITLSKAQPQQISKEHRIKASGKTSLYLRGEIVNGIKLNYYHWSNIIL